MCSPKRRKLECNVIHEEVEENDELEEQDNDDVSIHGENVAADDPGYDGDDEGDGEAEDDDGSESSLDALFLVNEHNEDTDSTSTDVVQPPGKSFF